MNSLPIRISVETSAAEIAGRSIRLTPAQAVVLSQLARQPGRIVLTDDLFKALYGHGEKTDKALRWHVMSLRRILTRFGLAIVSRRGRGWLLMEHPGEDHLMTFHGKRNARANLAQ